jgi:hypothetical protein
MMICKGVKMENKQDTNQVLNEIAHLQEQATILIEQANWLCTDSARLIAKSARLRSVLAERRQQRGLETKLC